MNDSKKWGVAHLTWDDGYSEDGDDSGSPRAYPTRQEAEARAAKMTAEDWPRERWWVEPFDEAGPPGRLNELRVALTNLLIASERVARLQPAATNAKTQSDVDRFDAWYTMINYARSVLAEGSIRPDESLEETIVRVFTSTEPHYK